MAPVLTLAEIESLARRSHAGQTDKSGRPCAEHLAAVADGVRARGGSEEQIAAGWLHDALEDHALSLDWLQTAPLHQSVRDMVLALTRGEGEDLESYTRRILTTPGALLVKEADLASNTDPARLAALDEETRARLTAKYARTRALLGLDQP
ncbi:HD domain-containing protein [Streptomyces sp. NPDC001985]|uniref:HD domain-containing protein n=1 Tax=Streptomyces sp. NPDC001985 TaxID=3154406 RepID=UPI0033247808